MARGAMKKKTIAIIVLAVVAMAFFVGAAFGNATNAGNHFFSMETKAKCADGRCCDYFVIHDEGYDYTIPRGFDCYEK